MATEELQSTQRLSAGVGWGWGPMYWILIQVLTFRLSLLLAEGSRAPPSYGPAPGFAASKECLSAQERNHPAWDSLTGTGALHPNSPGRLGVEVGWGVAAEAAPAPLSILDPFTHCAGGRFQNETCKVSECRCPERNKQLRSP